MNGLLNYWDKKSLELIELAEDYSDLYAVVKEMLPKIRQPIGQVCGPITSGGKGSLEENLRIFEKTILRLSSKGISIFNQLPFETTLERIWKADKRDLKIRNLDLLEGFYLPIFESGFIKDLYFIYGWNSSFGTTWEHKEAKKIGLNIIYLPENFHEQ